MGEYRYSPPRRVSFIVFVLVVCVVTVVWVSGCGSDKGTTPTQTLTGSWPAEATGRYELVMEIKYCEQGPFVSCDWRSNWTDTLDLCGDPVVAYFMRNPAVSSVELTGVVSDSQYEIVATVSFGWFCESVYSFSTEGTGQPPSRVGWQFIRRSVSTTCGMEPDPEPDPAAYRYTYTRIGDAEYEGE